MSDEQSKLSAAIRVLIARSIGYGSCDPHENEAANAAIDVADAALRAEIAAAIAAARAEGEKAGRDAGVAIGAANMRGLVESAQSLFETCSVTTGDCCCGDNMEGHSSPLLCGHTATDSGEYSASLWLEEAKLALALPTDATAILAAERVVGREEMRLKCLEAATIDIAPGLPYALSEEIVSKIHALVLP